MNTVQAKMSSWVGAVGIAPATCPPGRSAAARASAEVGRGGTFSAEEAACFMRIVTEAGRIRRHADLYRWLGADIQELLPHEIMLSAWGDFSAWNLKLDLVSGLPGVRTAALGQCSLNALVREAYERWLDGTRNPVVLKMTDLASTQNACQCALHAGLQGMRSVLVHGIHDRRADHESLFLAFSSGYFTQVRNLEAVFAQIDDAFRRIPALPLREARLCSGHASVLELSTREIEVVEAMCRGRTNLEIAAALSISPFTVKNHVQRIFRKIGVNNRTQAAARYAEGLLHSAISSVARAQDALREAG